MCPGLAQGLATPLDGISADDDDISVTRGELLFQSQERSKTFSIQVICYFIILYTLLIDYTVYIYIYTVEPANNGHPRDWSKWNYLQVPL